MSPALPVVTLYGRPGCHLCDAAQRAIEKLLTKLEFELVVVNIEDDDELHSRYMFEIPVVAFAGEEIAKAPITERTLVEELESRLG